MSEPFVGEIRMFAGGFAPRGWALCDGQLLSISDNDALFSLFGTTYGGDGRTTFGLPDLRGRVPVHFGSGPGLPAVPLGQKAGAETVTLTSAHLAGHAHPLQVTTTDGPDANPGGAVIAGSALLEAYADEAPDSPFSAAAIQPTGGGTAHENMQPYLCVNFIVSLFGVYPSRS